MPYGKINERQVGAVNQSTDFLDYTVQVTVLTSGAANSAGFLLQGQPVCIDFTNLVTNNVTTPAIEQCVLPNNATSAGAPLGIYQGATISNTSTSASAVYTVNIRQKGYGVILCGGVTTSVTVGSCVTILPGSTPPYASQLIPSLAISAQTAVFALGNTVATGAINTKGGIVISASTTTQGLVNAYINVAGNG